MINLSTISSASLNKENENTLMGNERSFVFNDKREIYVKLVFEGLNKLKEWYMGQIQWLKVMKAFPKWHQCHINSCVICN